jgi:hypothetical protein
MAIPATLTKRMEISMSIKRVASLTFAAVVATSLIASTTANAFPPKLPPLPKPPLPAPPLPGPVGPGPGFGLGFGAGMLGAAIVGSAIAASNHSYYRSCRWVRQFDEDGYYLGRARVCN